MNSKVKMNETSVYVTTVVFMDRLKNHFTPRKESGNVLLILDGHRSHCSDVNVLDFAAENGITLLSSKSNNALLAASRQIFLQAIEDILAASCK
jgi:hypothetical protein